MDTNSNAGSTLHHNQTWTGSAVPHCVPGTPYPTRLSADPASVGSGLRADLSTPEGDIPNGLALPVLRGLSISAVQTLNLGNREAPQLRFDVINLFNVSDEIRNGTGVGSALRNLVCAGQSSRGLRNGSGMVLRRRRRGGDAGLLLQLTQHEHLQFPCQQRLERLGHRKEMRLALMVCQGSAACPALHEDETRRASTSTWAV